MSNRDKDYVAYSLSRVEPNCADAIATMRRALDDAARGLGDRDTTPERMIQSVMNRFAWGYANATTSLVSAVAALEDARKMAEASE